jgi:PTH1 family peptidyl-tRNA hydrolase
MVVGIGNPGREYEGTRHNIGFEVVRLIAERKGVALDSERMPGLGRAFGRLGRVRDRTGEVSALLLEPWTYVNESGRAVRAAAVRADLQPAEILVVVDDFHLDLGVLRIRERGSSGGHNGLKSIETHLGSRDYPRLRVGIGSPGRDSVDHVLSRFSRRDREDVEVAVARAADAVEEWISTGDLKELMNRYNSRSGN